MDRVVVLGRGGAGKSVLALQLGEITGLPVIELDAEFWNERLEPLPPEEWRRRQESLAQPATWIMDGDLGPHDELEPRLRRADTVVLLDMPLWLCVGGLGVGVTRGGTTGLGSFAGGTAAFPIT